MRPLFSWSSILSVRGAILLLLGIYLLLGPASREMDIVAAVVGGTFVVIVLGATFLTTLLSWQLRRNLKISFSSPENISNFSDAHSAVPNSPLVLVTTLNKFNVPPGFILSLQINFLQDGVETTLHSLSGNQPSLQRLSEIVNFPHRGDWSVRDFALTFGDRFGISLANWSFPVGQKSPNVRIFPPISQGNSIPVMSSCHRAGDELVDTNNREGDLFDLKRYHPSDGVNRILWKIYAKSGELISRHPESAVAPEGQVALFAITRPQDDIICSELIAYLKVLERHGLDVLVGCSGMGQRSAARNSQKAEELLIESVWEGANLTRAEMLREVEFFISSIRSRDQNLQFDRVLLFFEGEIFDTSEEVSFAAEIGDLLSSIGIEPVFIVKPPDGVVIKEQRRIKSDSSISLNFLSRIGRLFVTPQNINDSSSGDCFSEFLALCLRRQWQLVSP